MQMETRKRLIFCKVVAEVYYLDLIYWEENADYESRWVVAIWLYRVLQIYNFWGSQK